MNEPDQAQEALEAECKADFDAITAMARGMAVGGSHKFNVGDVVIIAQHNRKRATLWTVLEIYPGIKGSPFGSQCSYWVETNSGCRRMAYESKLSLPGDGHKDSKAEKHIQHIREKIAFELGVRISAMEPGDHDGNLWEKEGVGLITAADIAELFRVIIK